MLSGAARTVQRTLFSDGEPHFFGHMFVPHTTDGISLFGRETPAYILKEVNRRQLADRGTSSLWAKLAADYGPRHANFIVKHNTKFPNSRNDRNRQDMVNLHRSTWTFMEPFKCSKMALSNTCVILQSGRC